MNAKLKRILPLVQKPARYTGGEYNQIIKDKAQIDVRVAFCFPDTYEIGMSNLGMRILYGTMNSLPNVWCERVFAPWLDMEEQMRKHGIPLYALESGDPVKDFDIIAFSVGYEMAYSNILNMLDLAGIPILAKDRHDLKHMVMAGGTCTYNAEPLADFLDLVLLGEGEELDNEVCILYAQAKKEGWSKAHFLNEAALIEGVYVPSLYDVEYKADGTVSSITPRGNARAVNQKRIILDMDKSYFPTKTIIPSTEIIHDRTTLEVFRGCIRGCRFCQAGYAYRPVRAKSPEVLLEQAKEALTNSGYQEITLSSLSTSDYKHLGQLCDDLLDFCVPRKTGLSLPSLRADNFSMELMKRLQKVRRSGLTFAPEAGTQRLRDAINKNVTEEDLLTSCATAFSGGWNTVKLYFMIGLPTETDEDVLGIADLAYKVLDTWRKTASVKNRGVTITVSTSCFVPKPHTPFQWEAQNTMEEFKRKEQLLKDALKSRSINYNWHDPSTSYLEAVFARGDRRLGAVLYQAWKDGAKMDGWNDGFDMDRWMKAFEKCGVDPEFYALRQREQDELLPWSMVSVGVDTEYMWRERQQAYKSVITPDCRVKCMGCGANKMLHGGKCDE